VSGVVDHVVDLSTVTREKALRDGEALAISRAISNGARADTVVIKEKSETQLAYLKGGATRVQIKAVGDLALGKIKHSMYARMI
jgi:aspartate 1-decarboxylase